MIPRRPAASVAAPSARRPDAGPQPLEAKGVAVGAEIFEAQLRSSVPRGPTRLAMLVIELFIGIPAIPAGVGLMRDGLGMPNEWISHSLFPNYALPGVLLIGLIGGGMVGAAAITLRRSVLAGPAAIAIGLVQIAWLASETFIVGWHGGPQLLLVGIIGLLAVVLLVLGSSVTSVRLQLLHELRR